MLEKGAIICVLALLLPCGGALANPASTDYVRASVEASYQDMRQKLEDITARTNSSLDELKNQLENLPIITRKIGDVFEGGMVFYVDNSRQHGLMASLSDISDEGIEWRNGEGGDRAVNARAEGLGSGEANTRLIIAQQTIDDQEGRFAALMAANYETRADGKSPCSLASTSAKSLCYSGWFLPSAQELSLMYANLKAKNIGVWTSTPYWSSTETSATEAVLVDFGDGHAEISEKSVPARVRAVRAF